MKRNGDPVMIYDCTLRDGTQGENISLSVEDKLHIARRLDQFGVQYIEGGWPGSNEKDAQFFEMAKTYSWSSSQIVAFGSTRHWKHTVEQDPNLAALIKTKTKTVTLVGKSWDFHVKNALKLNLRQNLQIIRESVSFLKLQHKEVIFDAEHFFDGYKSNPEYALQVLNSAREAGADWIVLCDTNGGALPSAVSHVVCLLKPLFPRLGIHTHDDCGLGVANSIAAVEQGATMVQGTINGYGERCGNANLCSIIPVLELKMGRPAVTRTHLEDLTSMANFVSETANVGLSNNQPFVGQSAFAHKAGLHVSGILRNPRTYEHMEPQQVGNNRRVLLSDLSGRSNLLYKIREFGKIDPSIVDLKPLLQQIKSLEYQGYQFECAEGSFHLLLRQYAGQKGAPFKFKGFRVLVDQGTDGIFLSKATVRIDVDGTEEHTAAEGNGPVDALACAVRKALIRFFPQIEKIRLTDYKVRVLDAQNGTAAKVRVLIESTDGNSSWTTIGVSYNVIEASWEAIVDSIMHKLVFEPKLEPTT